MILSSADEQFLASRLKFWDKLSPEEKRSIIASSSTVHYSAQYRLRTGDRSCIGIIAIKNGQLRVSILSPEGRDITLFRLSSGQVCVLSAACILDAITFDICIESESETDALIVKADMFRRLSETNIYMKEFSYELAAERFSEVMWTMQQILFMKFDQRLAVFLLRETEKNGNLHINLTHEQIARYTGSAREVVTRMLNYFSSENIVALSRGTVTVLDNVKLKKIAGNI